MEYQAPQPGSPQQAENAGVEEPFPLLDYLQLLWFRRRLILVVTLFVAIIGFIHVNQLVPVYTADSTLMIGVTKAQVEACKVEGNVSPVINIRAKKVDA